MSIENMTTLSISTDANLSNITKFDQNLCEEKKLDTKRTLRKKLKFYEIENQEFRNILSQKDEEIIELRKKISSLNDLINSVQIVDLGKGSTIASSKIFDLSKRNRHLTAELQSYKTKYSKLNLDLTKLQKEFEDYRQQSIIENSVKKEPCCESATKIESLQEKLYTTKTKLFEALNNNNKLKNDLKLAQKCLQQEIGEDVNLNTLLSSNSNWRGRSQQILSLQMKVNELKEKLDNCDQSSLNKIDLRRLETSKKSEIIELNTQISNLKSIIEEQKNKISALKTRNKNLLDETMNYKLKTLNLIEQTGNSDNSIQNLNEQINMQKYLYENKIKNLQKEIENLINEKTDKDQTIQNLEDKLCEMGQINEKKQKEIDQLNEIIQKLEADLRLICGDFLFSCRDLKKEEFFAILDSLESEKSGLLQRNTILLSRLDDEREKVDNLTEQVSKLKIKCIRHETKLKEIQKEQEIQQEKKKRSQRIAKFSQSLQTCKIPTIVIENSKTELQTESSQLSEQSLFLDLKYKLELAKEKTSLLEEKISNLLKEKEVDLKMFDEMMNNTKSILLSMIQQYKNKNCNELGLQTDN